MKAVVFHGVGDIRLDDVSDPQLRESTDAIVRITASAICCTDLHMVQGTIAGVREGTILGHEGVGIVEEVGEDVRNLERGDRVVICSTIACGTCFYCRCGHFSQCDGSNPNGPAAGVAIFGGPEASGPFDGLQAERARIPYADTTCIKLPDEVTDEQAIFLSDLFPTGYFGAGLAGVTEGSTVAVFGCGPVGQFAIASAMLLGASRVFAIDTGLPRLDLARLQGAEVIDYEAQDPVRALRIFTAGMGVDCAIDAFEMNAHGAPLIAPTRGAKSRRKAFKRKLRAVVARTKQNGRGSDERSRVLSWAVDALAKAGTLAIVGSYPNIATTFPIGKAMAKNISVRMGHCNHRHYIPALVELVRTGQVDPMAILGYIGPSSSALDAYRAFEKHQMAGWTKVAPAPTGAPDSWGSLSS